MSAHHQLTLTNGKMAETGIGIGKMVVGVVCGCGERTSGIGELVGENSMTTGS